MTQIKKKSARAIDRTLFWLVGKGRTCCLCTIMVITLPLAYFAARVPIEHDNASMVSQSRALLENYATYRNTFGNDEVLLLALTHPQLLGPEGLLSIDRMTRAISELQGISGVLSLTNAQQLVPGDFGAEARPLIPKPFRADDLDKTIKTLEQNPRLSRMLISKDRHTGIVIIDLADDADPQGHLALYAIKNLLAKQADGFDWHLTGIPLQKLTVSRLIQRDQKVIIPFSVVVLGILLLLMFRRISGLLVPLAVMTISLCWTVGLYSLCGYALNTITALLPPVIMVLSISTTVHLYSGWLQLAGKQGDPKGLVIEEMHGLFLPCLFTALTTALGLASLLVSEVPAVRLFGAFAAVGVMLAFLINILLVPSLLSFLPIPAAGRRLFDTGVLRRILQAAGSLTINYPRPVLVIGLILALAGLSGLGRIDNNTDLVRFLKPDSRLYRDTMFIEQAVGGVNRIEFMLTRSNGKPLTSLESMASLEKLQASIDQMPNVTGSFSLVDVLSQLNRAEHNLARATLPDNSRELRYLFDLLESAPDQKLLRKIVSPDFIRWRLSVLTGAIGTAEAAELVSNINRIAKQHLGGSFDLQPTGDYYQVVFDSNRLVTSVIQSFSLSLGMVLLAILLLFRSLKLMGMALIPNLIPLAWTGGLMGFLDIDLSTGTAMIAAVVIGLTVDSTIHYLARFQRESRGSSEQAVRITTIATGRALTISALVLFFGFSVGGLSSFLPTIYFSILTGITMLGALACDLLVLPASLILCQPKSRSQSA